MQTYQSATRGNTLAEMEELVEQCMADYDETGWRNPAWAEDERP
jgi:4-hydroxyphenylacetate 3-monooxygenase